MRLRGVFASALALVACSACAKADKVDGASRAPVDAGLVGPVQRDDAASARVEALVIAEQRRMAESVTDQDLSSRTTKLRRAASRTLARVASESARPGLLRALSDEDDEVVAWAAYGLGMVCAGHERDTVAALAARFAVLSATTSPSTSGNGRAPDAGSSQTVLASPAAAIARSVGRCGSDVSEPTLVAWLSGSRDSAVAASFALGDLANLRRKLREETIAALMNIASGSVSMPAMAEALQPVGRLEALPPNVRDRVREVAEKSLESPGDARLFVIRALARTGPEAASTLEKVLRGDEAFSAAERAEAARGLKRLGVAGSRPLAEALAKEIESMTDGVSAAWTGDAFGVFTTMLESIESPGPSDRSLRTLAALPLADDLHETALRRRKWARCAAANLLAGDNVRDPRLVDCDPAKPLDKDVSSPVAGRALARVIGRGRITQARASAWRDLALNGDLRAREDAIDLLAEHEEIQNPAEVLVAALRAEARGLVGTAADVIAKHPERAVDVLPTKRKRKARRNRDGAADPSVVTSAAVVAALLDALRLPGLPDDPELAASVADAVGALALAEAKPELEALCRSPFPTNRDHAAKALGLIGAKTTCPPVPGEVPEELVRKLVGNVVLSFDTDAGVLAMSLDATIAPIAVTRVVELARSGFYDGKIVHRVVPGYVAQFGAPRGDGWGGPLGKPPLRCETSPISFNALDVGVALAGRDTGSSQLFVMRGSYPHLDGAYAWLGKASGSWSSLADGDVIRKVTVTP